MRYDDTYLVLQNSRARYLDRFILSLIALHAGNDDGSGAFPSISRLARLAGCSISAVNRGLKTLKALGEIEIISSPPKPNQYRVVIPNSGSHASTSSHATIRDPQRAAPKTSNSGIHATINRSSHARVIVAPTLQEVKRKRKGKRETAAPKPPSDPRIVGSKPLPVPVKKAAARPTQSRARQFFAKKGFHADPEKFWLHYEQRGWVDTSGQPIQNWRAAATLWEKREPSMRFGSRTFSSSASATNPADFVADIRKHQEASRLAKEKLNG